ncbi:hypothetical protein, partial [Paenibacillus odorifer]|uniref:hypothetical protein n=1 Tax=Paenibacillus odorifer TaxID=189426 RepID=UPI001C4AB73A
ERYAHFETSDEKINSLILDITYVISYSLVVQFSKIKFSLTPFNVSAATLIIYHVVFRNASFIFRSFLSASFVSPVRCLTTLTYNTPTINRKATPNIKINN